MLADAYVGDQGLMLGTARRMCEHRLHNELRNKSLAVAANRAALERKRNALRFSIETSEAEIQMLETQLEISKLDIDELEQRVESIRRT